MGYDEDYEDDYEDEEVDLIEAVGTIAIGVAIGAGIVALLDILSKSGKGGR